MSCSTAPPLEAIQEKVIGDLVEGFVGLYATPMESHQRSELCRACPHARADSCSLDNEALNVKAILARKKCKVANW